MKTIYYFLLTGLFVSALFQCRQVKSPESPNRISIDITEKRAPISPYIYGQFIEHLGRCIYGGIWAEMLEDRKFYYPVTSDYNPWDTKTDEYWNAGEFPILVASPWKVEGASGSVTMTTDDPFVGEHDPMIRINDLPAGISQEGLLFIKNREYEGRIYLASGNPELEVTISIEDQEGTTKQIAGFTGLSDNYARYDFSFTSDSDFDNGVLKILGNGTGAFRIGTISLMPADHMNGFNRAVLSFLKELNAPIYRWPGGNFVSGYNWKDGIGDRDTRPPRKNPAWTGIEPNDVGIHEYMNLCRILSTEPFICVNTGLGTMEEVAEQVEYCNGSVDSPMGKWRAANGHPEPWHVKFWAVGNEMYGEWQLGHMPLSEYVKKHNRVAEEMWKKDSTLTLVAVGNAGEWSKTMLSECPDHMNLISEHIYCKELEDVQEHVKQIPDNIKRVAEVHRQYRNQIPGLVKQDIRIAMDEWNYWHGDYLYGELGCRYYLKDALGIAAGFHEYFRNSDLFFMANYAQTVNVIGAIKTTRKDVEFAATGIILKLYRNHYGQIPVKVENVPEPLNIEAALDSLNSLLTLAVINPGATEKDFNIIIEGLPSFEISDSYEVSNNDPMAYNAPGEKREIDIVPIKPTYPDYIEVKPYSVTFINYRIK
jgi:alpha-N-arabinofuranosidase